MRTHKRLKGYAGFVLLSACAQVTTAGPLEDSQADPRVDEIISTGVRDTPIAQLPRSASVITSGDIALAAATNVVDLLASEANLTLRSTAGNEKFSGIDIRGQGDTYSSNVLLLIDGVSINEADLSGADYSTVALGQIERIEILRGPNTVRYGNGAVGGVINIITRSPEPGFGLNARSRYGSYSTTDSGVGASWANEAVWFGVDGAYFDSEGYRDNSDLEKKDLLLKGGVSPVTWLQASATASWHRDKYGLPGPISKEQFDGSSSDREATERPFDGGETDDDRLRGDVRLGAARTGILKLTGVTRDRDNQFRLGAPAADEPYSNISEDSDTVYAQYEYDVDWLGRSHALVAGFEGMSTDYAREDTPEQIGSENKIGDIRQQAWFLAADMSLSDTLRLTGGYRQDRYRLDSRDEIYTDNLCDDPVVIGLPPNQITICNDSGGPRTGYRVDRDERNTWRNSAVEAGVVWNPSQQTSLYFAYAQSFRNPNVDELVFAADDLGPQTSDNWEAGIRRLFGSMLELSLGLFYSETDDEILFSLSDVQGNLLLPKNINAPEVVERTGGEFEVRWYALPELRFIGNLGYTKAEFEGSGNTLPLVPEWTGALTVQWNPHEDWTMTVTGNYVDDRVDGNDFTNDVYPELESYEVVDAKLSWDSDSLQIYGGINNLLDEEYATSVYSENYYPMPDRNYYVGFAYRM